MRYIHLLDNFCVCVCVGGWECVHEGVKDASVCYFDSWLAQPATS